MGKQIRFATVGTSKITEKFLQAASGCEDAVYVAAYSRDLEKAKNFAKKHGASKAYDSLEKMAADPEIDGVYLASPNFLHYSQAMLLLQAGKHVLCEKPLASNAAEAEMMQRTAKQKGLILLEAIRPMFDPGFEQIRQALPRLGKLRRADFWYGKYSSKYDAFLEGKRQNIFDRNCSTGALMDMGVYCVEPMVGLFGMPKSIQAQCVSLRGGIDGATTILADYGEMMAEISCSKITNSARNSEIQGEKGVMIIHTIAEPSEIVCRYYDGREERIETEPCENNMIYEIRRWVQAILHGEDVSFLHQQTLWSMKVMEEARKQMGILFPADTEQIAKN